MTTKVPYTLLTIDKFADIASAATINLDTVQGAYGQVTGVVAITAITLAEGKLAWVRFTGILTLTNGASLALPGAADITTAAGDWALFATVSGVVYCIYYTKANGKAPVAAIAAGDIAAINNSALPVGTVVQVVNTTSGALVTGSTVTPFDDTIPQSTEGTAIPLLDTAITPKSATNLLRIDVVVVASPSAVSHVILALFKDAGANALAASAEYAAAGGAIVTVALTWFEVAASVVARTYKVRAGNNAAATLSINGASSARVFGGVCVSSITVTEIKA